MKAHSASSSDSETVPTTNGSPELNSFQREVVEFFVRAVAILSLPKSLGEIYGLLFSTQEPLSLDDIIARLQMSRGSASQGVRWLKDIGAVKTVYIAGVRKDHFTAETELRKLAAGFLREQVESHVESSAERLRSIKATIDRRNGDFENSRLSKIERWQKFVVRTLPVVKALSSKF